MDSLVVELDVPVQAADGLQEPISRDYSGNAVVQWFDQMDPAGNRLTGSEVSAAERR